MLQDPMAADSSDQSRVDCRIGVVMPLANEEATVDDLLHRVLAQLSDRDCVFCVVDNVSKDQTKQRVELSAKKDPRVRLVWAPENRSVVDAYFRGYREALDFGCLWILEMDGGLSHLPEEIPRFIQAMEQGVDLAAGSRFIRGGRHRGSFSRYWISRGGSMLANLLLGTRMKDMTSGFECFSREAMEYVLARGVRSRAHFFQTEIRQMLHDRPWVEVPITYTNPAKSVGSDSIKDALKCLWALRKQVRAG